jgi:DNA polymerase-3 subunit gamma/tau
MSYLVLARKYRPRNFAEMVGQDHVVQALTNALGTQRLHHAYFFTGTRGVGKTTVSRILAKSLNCQGADGQGGITPTPCGVCDACSAIDSGRFVDYIELDAASNRGVEEVQSLLEQAVYKPVQGRFKVFMIDEVHMLTNTAFNAMLKTLEEPPSYLKFVLATTDPQKVPVTVLSRCLQFNLRPMAPLTIQEHLARVLEVENVAADAQSLRLIARAARGSMRDALSLTDQAIAFGSGQLQEGTVRQMLGSVDRTVVYHLIDAITRVDGARVVELVELLRSHGLNASSTLEEMTHVLQQMAVLQTQTNLTSATEEPDADPDASQTRRLASLLPHDETHLLYSIGLHGRADLGLAPDEYSALTMVLLRMLAFKPGPVQEKKTLPDLTPLCTLAITPSPNNTPTTAPSTLTLTSTASSSAISSAAPSHPTPQPLTAPVIETTKSSPKPPSAPALPIVPVSAPVPAHTESTELDGELGDFWFALVQQLLEKETIVALVRQLALHSQLVSKLSGAWQLRVERESLMLAANRQRLSLAIQQLGWEVTLNWQPGPVTDTPYQRITAAQTHRQSAAEQWVMQHPLVQRWMQDFSATIVPGTLLPL